MKSRFFKYPRDGQIYILPTWYGFWYGVMVFLSLIIAFYYQNNFTFVLVFLFIAFGLISLIQTHFHLKSFYIQISGIDSNHVDETVVFRALASGGQFPETVKYSVDGKDLVSFSSNWKAVWRTSYRRRGEKKIKKFLVSTDFPFGLFRAWKWTFCDYQFCVYPRLAEDGISSVVSLENGSDLKGTLGQEDISSLDRWKKGDSYRHILWRKYSPFTGWQVKKFQGGATKIIKLVIEENRMGEDLYIEQCARSLHDLYKNYNTTLIVDYKGKQRTIDEYSYYDVMEQLAKY